MIREALAGKRVVLSGVTGYLGAAVLERLLTDTDVERIDAIARGDAPVRIGALLDTPVFGPARERLGAEGLRTLFDRKVRALTADLTREAPAVDADVDVVIHSAATVSFDPPIDEAFETNLLGSVRLLEASRGRPFVHVSTAYVAGMTRGTQPEELLRRGLDWRGEAERAVQQRDVVEDESRRPEQLERFEAKARAEVGRAGPQTVAAQAESLRAEWVAKRLVRAGAARARSLGWPDVYAFTKALTEQALDELAGEDPLVIVRPSIIESAYRHPFPGWIEGFRVAEPVILAYGRGALPEFPGIPEGALDLIPVDMVVNCLLAVTAKQVTAPERRGVYHISSGHRNPFRFRRLYELTREYFLEDPLPERDRGAFKPPVWRFPGRRAVDRRIRLSERAIEAAERFVGRLPRTSAARETLRKVDRARGQLDFVRRYAELYGHYVEVEAIYTDDRTRRLFEDLPEDDRGSFPFDVAAFTWEEYYKGIHLPAVSAPLRAMTAAPKRPAPSIAIHPVTEGNGTRPVIAAFDLEGTVVASNVLESYLWLCLAEGNPADRVRDVAAVARRLPALLGAERRDRGEFLRKFYRMYEGADAEQVRALASRRQAEMLLRRLAPAAVRRIKQHRDAGHVIVFITGSLDFIIEPLSSLADVMVTAGLHERAGRFTGDMDRPPLVGEARASWLRSYAAEIGADLGASYAYADSMSDLPLLEVVGNPAAVNPDIGLTRMARARRWPIEEWEPNRGTPKVLIPEPSP